MSAEKNSENNCRKKQSMETRAVNRRTVLGVSVKTLGALYLAPATATLLTGQRATAQSQPSCTHCGHQLYNNSPTEQCWTITYTDCNLVVHNQEPIPTQPVGGPDIPLDYEVCCGTDIRIQSSAACHPPNHDSTSVACGGGGPFAPVDPPW